MRRGLRFTCAALALAAVGCGSWNQSPRSTILVRSEQGELLVGPAPRIVIDAGHGGHDPGALYGSVEEKHLALGFARKLQQRLQLLGYDVRMTRSRDVFLPLEERIRIANDWDADLFVSIHLNAHPSAGVTGSEIYIAREWQRLESRPWPAALPQTAVASDQSDVQSAVWELVFNRNRRLSESASGLICGELRSVLGAACREKTAGFVVLRQAEVPAVLVEIGYLSNDWERSRLQSVEYQDAVVSALTEGIRGYALGVMREEDRLKTFSEAR